MCCWNWFLLVNQVCDFGELVEIVVIIVQVIQQYDVDWWCVYVGGLLVGVLMSVILVVCYFDVFVVVVVYGGIMYKVVMIVFDVGKVMVIGKLFDLEQIVE